MLFDDDDCLRETLANALRFEGFAVTTVSTPAGVSESLDQLEPDIAVFDVYIDGEPRGIEALQRVRRRSDIPVLFLSASTKVDDRLAGFAAGGDDFLTKPFVFRELVARLEALLRRNRPADGSRHAGDIKLDEDAHRAQRGDHTLDLTNIEFRLLAAFVDHPGQVLSKRQLLAMVWDFEHFDVNLVEVHVSALRRKLEQWGVRVIHTVRGVGYVLRADAS